MGDREQQTSPLLKGDGEAANVNASPILASSSIYSPESGLSESQEPGLSESQESGLSESQEPGLSESQEPDAGVSSGTNPTPAAKQAEDPEQSKSVSSKSDEVLPSQPAVSKAKSDRAPQEGPKTLPPPTLDESTGTKESRNKPRNTAKGAPKKGAAGRDTRRSENEGIIWFNMEIATAAFRNWLANVKARVMSFTAIDIVMAVQWLVLLLCLLRVTIFSAVYFIALIIGIPMAMGSTEKTQSFRMKISVCLVVYALLVLLTNVAYQMHLFLSNSEDTWGDNCNYFTPQTNTRPFHCTLGIEKLSTSNFWLLLPEVAVIAIASTSFAIMKKRRTVNLPATSTYISSIEGLHLCDGLVVNLSFLIAMINPSLLTFPILALYIFCSVYWAFFMEGDILQPSFSSFFPHSSKRRSVVLVALNVYSFLYALGIYVYNVRGIPAFRHDAIIGFNKVSAFNGFYPHKYFPLLPLVCLKICLSLLLEFDGMQQQKHNDQAEFKENEMVPIKNPLLPSPESLSEAGHNHSLGGQKEVALSIGDPPQDENTPSPQDDSTPLKGKRGTSISTDSVMTIQGMLQGGYNANKLLWKSLTHPYLRFIWCTAALLFGVFSLKVTILTLIFLIVFAFGLFFPELVFHKWIPFIIVYTVMYMITLYIGSSFISFALVANADDPVFTNQVFLDIGISWLEPDRGTGNWLPSNQERMLFAGLLFGLFCSVWKAQMKPNNNTVLKPFKGMCRKSLRYALKLIQIEKYFALLVFFSVSYANVDLFHWLIFTFSLLVMQVKGGSAGKTFLSLWKWLNYIAVSTVLSVYVLKLPSLASVLISVENSLGFEKIFNYKNTFENKTLANNMTAMSESSTASGQYSRLQNYGDAYSIISIAFLTIAVAFAVVHIRVIGRMRRRSNPSIASVSTKVSMDDDDDDEYIMELRPARSNAETADEMCDSDEPGNEEKNVQEGTDEKKVEETEVEEKESVGNDPLLGRYDSFLRTRDFGKLKGSFLYRVLYKHRVSIFMTFVVLHVCLMLSNVFRYPISAVGVAYLIGALWAVSFPYKTIKQRDRLPYTFSKFYGKYCRYIAFLAAFVASSQYLFACSIVNGWKIWINSYWLHASLKLHHFGVIDEYGVEKDSLLNKANAFENAVLSLVSVLLWRVPKVIFKVKAMTRSEKINAKSSFVYLQKLVELQTLSPLFTSAGFTLYACFNRGLIGFLYLLLSLYWVEFRNCCSGKCKTITSYLVYVLTPLVLVLVYIWQFPFFLSFTSSTTDWIGLRTGPDVEGTHDWGWFVALHFSLYVLLASQHLWKKLFESAMRAEDGNDSQLHPIVPALKERLSEDEIKDERKSNLLDYKVQVVSFFYGWEVERFIAVVAISSAFRGDVVGMLHLTVAGAFMLLPREKCRSWWNYVMTLFTAVFVFQYVMRLGTWVEGYTDGFLDVFEPSSTSVFSHVVNATFNTTKTVQKSTLNADVEKTRAILRWLSIQNDDPVLAIWDALILALMILHQKLFEAEASIRKSASENKKLDISVRNKFNEKPAILDVATWYDDVNDKNAYGIVHDIKNGYDIVGESEEDNSRRASFILPDFDSYLARDFHFEDDFSKSKPKILGGWSLRIGSHGKGYYRNGKDGWDHFEWFVYRYSRTVATLIICFVSGHCFNLMSLVYIFICINILMLDAASSEERNARVWWRSLVGVSFFALWVRLAFQYPDMERLQTRDSVDALFGFGESHTFYKNRIRLHSSNGWGIIMADVWVFIIALLQQRVHTSRLFTYTAALKHRGHQKGKLLGQSAFYILELQRLFIEEDLQDEIAYVVNEVMVNAMKRRSAAVKQWKIGHRRNFSADRLVSAQSEAEIPLRMQSSNEDDGYILDGEDLEENAVDPGSNAGSHSDNIAPATSLKKTTTVRETTQQLKDDAQTFLRQFTNEAQGELERLSNDLSINSCVRVLYKIIAFTNYFGEVLREKSYFVVLFALTLSYFVQMTLFSMFYPIFMFTVLTFNPQQLPGIKFEDDKDKLGLETEMENGHPKYIYDVQEWYNEWCFSMSRRREGTDSVLFGPKTRDGLHYSSHLAEFNKEWGEHDYQMPQFIHFSAKTEQSDMTNHNMLAALVNMIHLKKKRKKEKLDEMGATEEEVLNTAAYNPSLHEEGDEGMPANSFVRCLGRPFVNCYKQSSVNHFVQNVPIPMWNLALAWVSLHILLQFTWQLPNLCACYSPWSPANVTHPSYIASTYFNAYPYCNVTHIPEEHQKCEFTPAQPGQTNFSKFDTLFGVEKVYPAVVENSINHIVVAANSGLYISSIGSDLFLFFAIVFHIRSLKANGAGYLGSYVRNANPELEGKRSRFWVVRCVTDCCNRITHSVNSVVYEIYLSICPDGVHEKYPYARQKPGEDFYALTVTFQLCLLIYVFTYGITDINTVVQGGFTFKWSMRVIYVVCCIVADRIIYMWRRVNAKCCLLIIQLVVFLLCMHHNFGGEVFEGKNLDLFRVPLFIIHMPYFYYSSLQISYGYPPFVGEPVLLKYETWADSLVWYTYKMIPLVYELKVLLDWYCLDSVMFITDNTKFEDIRQSLYIVGCGLDYVAREGIRPRGMKQPGKLVTGFGSFLLILVLMFLPFFFFSFSEQASEGKAVLMVSVQLGVVGYPAMYKIDQIPVTDCEEKQSCAEEMLRPYPSNTSVVGCNDLSWMPYATGENNNPPSTYACLEKKYNTLAKLDSSDRETIFLYEGQLLYLPWTSGTNWPITTAKREELRSAAAVAPERMKFFLQLTLLREDQKTYTFRREVPLFSEEKYNSVTNRRLDLINLLNETSKNLVLNHLFPRFLRLPRSGNVMTLDEMTGMATHCTDAGASSKCMEDAYLSCLLTLGTPSVNYGNVTTNASSTGGALNQSSIELELDDSSLDTMTNDERLIADLRKQLQLSWSLQCGEQGLGISELEIMNPRQGNTMDDGRERKPSGQYEFFVFSSKYNEVVGSFIDVSSIVPLLFLCFVSIGGFIRVFFTGTAPHISFYDLPNHKALKDLVKNIDLARRIANVDALFLKKLMSTGQDMEDLKIVLEQGHTEEARKIINKLEQRIYGRPMLTEEYHRQMIEDRKGTRKLVEHYDALIVERYRRAGLEIEDEIFRELIDVYRCPEKIYERTGPYRHWWGPEHETRPQLNTSPFHVAYTDMEKDREKKEKEKAKIEKSIRKRKSMTKNKKKRGGFKLRERTQDKKNR
jgi:hypothetical protein